MRMKPKVHTQKHIVQFPIASITAGATNPMVVALAVLEGAKTTNSDVEVGSDISAIFVELWIQSATVSGSFTLTVEKRVANATAITAAQMAGLHDYDNKKNIFFSSQGLTSDGDGAGPVPILRQWIKIPRGKQRMAQGDSIVVNLLAQATDIQRCGLTVYKEQF